MSEEVPEDLVETAATYPPGQKRRQMLRAAGADIQLSDFSDEERLLRWRLGPG